MKKLIITLSFLTATVVILIASGFINAVLLFIVVGVIPGTDYTVPASTMLAAIVAISWTLLLPFVSIKSLAQTIVRHIEKYRILLKKHLAQHHFGKV